MILECDCGDVMDLPEEFFDGGAATFWRRHGHFPASLILRCSCGAEQRSGERVHGKNARGACAADAAFYRAHQPHDMEA